MFESEKKQPKKIKIPTKISLPCKQTWIVNNHSHSCSPKELQKLDLVMTRIQIQMGQNTFVIVLQNTCNCLSRRIGWYQGCLSFDLFLGCAWHFPSCRAFEWSVYQSLKCWWENIQDYFNVGRPNILQTQHMEASKGQPLHKWETRELKAFPKFKRTNKAFK